MNWTDEQDALLVAAWERGDSTRRIGIELLTSKNAIVGRSHRLMDKGLIEPRPSPIRRDPDGVYHVTRPKRVEGPTIPLLRSQIEAPFWCEVNKGDTVILSKEALERGILPESPADRTGVVDSVAGPRPRVMWADLKSPVYMAPEHLTLAPRVPRAPVAPVMVKAAPRPVPKPVTVVRPPVASPAPPSERRPAAVIPAPYGRVVHCLWPIGNPGTVEFHFCDIPSEPGRPYCGEHVQIAYVRVRDRREDVA